MYQVRSSADRPRYWVLVATPTVDHLSLSDVVSRIGTYLVNFECETASEASNNREIPGNDLLSHPVARAVPSALVGLTAVFGMGTGVSPPL